ncbi:MAG: hypothetical protein ABS75_04710 [Pelagibacterium sp. SCN 63-23]|nr:MAG: hypothetical protein ABS75_04710 [Pelagibacterium sp. SCN 63-23]
MLSAGCALCFAAAAYAAVQEFSGFLRFGTTVERIQQINADTPTGLSTSSMAMVLNDCSRAVTYARSLEFRYLGEQATRTIFEVCEAKVGAITALSPTNSLAWLTSARLAGQSGNLERLNSDLANSRLVAPNEQWLADLRIELAETYLSDLSAENRAGHDQDLRLMIISGVGLGKMAARYIRHEDFRDRITAIVETVPAFNQNKFINSLNRILRNAGY